MIRNVLQADKSKSLSLTVILKFPLFQILNIRGAIELILRRALGIDFALVVKACCKYLGIASLVSYKLLPAAMPLVLPEMKSENGIFGNGMMNRRLVS